MTKKNLRITALCLSISFLFISPLFSQDDKKEKINRPERCDVIEVDNFVNKCFDAYEESLKITEAVKFIKVEGDGDAKTITNANGEPVTKADALLQFGELLIRAKKQSDNIQALQDQQKSATESIKKCPIPKKPKATKNLGKGGEALTEVVTETKTQIELIDKQISDVKAMKE
jgi:hypothetical protein